MKKITGYYKSYNEKDDTIRWIASTDSVDRQGDSIDPNGWDLSNIGKNLPLLWAHNDRELPIGSVVNAYVEGNALVAEVKFANKVNEFAQKVYDLVKAGFLNAVSVGFMPKAYDNEGKMVQQELLELSVVNVPANQDALLSEMYQSFTKSLDSYEQKEIEKKSPACRMSSETKEQCVARKIPEILKENPGMKQDQAIAIAESVCDKACGDDDKPMEESKKEGRVLSEKNRNAVRIAIDSMRSATDALGSLLDSTEPPAKKGGVNKEPEVESPKLKGLYDQARTMDKIVEAMIHQIKRG
jgi:HK97 family phage prohead protease